MTSTDRPRTGRATVAVLGVSVVASALLTTGAAYGLSRIPVEEPAAVSWVPDRGAPAVAAVAAPTTDPRNCGGYVTGLRAGTGVPERR